MSERSPKTTIRTQPKSKQTPRPDGARSTLGTRTADPPIPTARRRRAPWIAVVAVLAAVALTLTLWQPWSGAGESAAPAREGAIAETLGEDPFILGTQATDGAVLVEFLDFQCPACARIKPVIDQMRSQYEGEVTFAVRTLPLDGHQNAVPAARAAAAADEQGAFESMYTLLFQNQTQWAGQPDPSATFRGYAEQIGLDMEQYDTDVASEQIAERVEADRQAAQDLGVTSTPSFFLDGEPIELQSVDQLISLLDEASAT